MNLGIRIFICALFFAGCKDRSDIPDSVLDRTKMQNVMWDMFLAQSMAQQLASGDSTTSVAIETKKLSNDVFRIHEITEKKFVESYQWYLRHPDLLNAILDSIYSVKSHEIDSVAEEPQFNDEQPLRKIPQLKEDRLKVVE